PIPPAPREETISYGPTRAPAANVIPAVPEGGCAFATYPPSWVGPQRGPPGIRDRSDRRRKGSFPGKIHPQRGRRALRISQQRQGSPPSMPPGDGGLIFWETVPQSSGGRGEADAEGAALPDLALHVDRGAVELRDVLDDREAQPRARPDLRA